MNEKLQNIVRSTYAIVLLVGIKLQYLQQIKILRGTFLNKGPALQYFLIVTNLVWKIKLVLKGYTVINN